MRDPLQYLKQFTGKRKLKIGRGGGKASKKKKRREAKKRKRMKL